MKTRYEVANNLKLEIYHGEYVQLDHRWKKSRVCDVFTRLYYVQSGSGYLRRNGQTILLEPGNVYLIPSGCEFAYGCTQLSKIFFHIAVTTADGLDLLSFIQNICWAPFSPQEFDELMQCRTGDYFNLIKLKLLLYKAVVECQAQYPTPFLPIRQYSDLVEHAIKHIQTNLSLQLDAANIAEALFVSESRLRKRFREETGIPLGKYIDVLVFLQAKLLLMNDTASISQISQTLGFCDQFYFSRRFRKKFHQTPSEFRREIRGESAR